MSSFEELRKRKLVQWTLAYLAGAWVALQLVNILAAQFGWPGGLERGLTVLLAFGLPVTLVLAWYHGEQGRQGVSGPELLMVAGILAVAGAAIAFVWDAPQAATVAREGETVPGTAEFGVLEAEPAEVPVTSRSVAILPLANQSPSEEHAWFAEAMTEEITTALSRVPELRVTSRSTADQFPESGMTIPEFAREVGVAHVIEGSVRRVEDEVRITVQLIDARADEHVWSETYEEPLADVLETQVEIARQVADRLAASFSERERERIFAGITDDPVAYDLYLRANELDEMISAEVGEKLELLNRALERDPEFALAWAEIAEVYFFRASVTGEPEWRDSVRASLDRAIELASEPALESAYRAAKILMLGQRPEEAIALLRRTMLQNPSDYSTAGFLGLAYWFAGDLASTVEWMRRAAELNPLDPAIWSNIAWYYTLLGLDDRSERALRRSIDIDPDRFEPWSALGDLRLLQGRYAEARVASDSAAARGDPLATVARGRTHLYAGEVDRAVAVLDSLPRQIVEAAYGMPTLALARRLAGDSAGAREALERVETRMRAPSTTHFARYMNLEVAGVRGDPAEAVEALRLYVDAGGRRARIIRRDPIFETVRADSAFAAELVELERIVERQRRRVEREGSSAP